jgi:hypothetical protein
LKREFPVICIQPGMYLIGDESVVDAKPTHFRHIDAPYWIDLHPVSVLEFSSFVCRGGYERKDWWSANHLMSVPSIDDRCELIRGCSQEKVAKDRPVMGLTWFEAHALARSYGGRLPFECEWEIAARHAVKRIALADDLLEWTADAFTSMYWRVDFLLRGVAWSADRPRSLISVRGRSANALVRHVCGRRGHDPEGSGICCGFRRVWDALPEKCLVI